MPKGWADCGRPGRRPSGGQRAACGQVRGGGGRRRAGSPGSTTTRVDTRFGRAALPAGNHHGQAPQLLQARRLWPSSGRMGLRAFRVNVRQPGRFAHVAGAGPSPPSIGARSTTPCARAGKRRKRPLRQDHTSCAGPSRRLRHPLTRATYRARRALAAGLRRRRGRRRLRPRPAQVRPRPCTSFTRALACGPERTFIYSRRHGG